MPDRTIPIARIRLARAPLRLLLPAAWLLLTRGVFKVPPGGHGEAGSMLKAEVAALPRLSPGERRVAMVMLATAAAWMFRPLMATLLPGLPVSEAAARLGESIVARLGDLPIEDAVRRSIPTQPSTIHRGWMRLGDHCFPNSRLKTLGMPPIVSRCTMCVSSWMNTRRRKSS